MRPPLHTPAPHLITKTTRQPLDHDLRRHDQARPLGGRRLGARHRVGVPVVRCGARTASMDCCCVRTAVMCSCSLWRLLASQATRSRRSSLLFERQQTQNPHTAPNQSPFRRLRRRPLDRGAALRRRAPRVPRRRRVRRHVHRQHDGVEVRAAACLGAREGRWGETGADSGRGCHQLGVGRAATAAAAAAAARPRTVPATAAVAAAAAGALCSSRARPVRRGARPAWSRPAPRRQTSSRHAPSPLPQTDTPPHTLTTHALTMHTSYNTSPHTSHHTHDHTASRRWAWRCPTRARSRPRTPSSSTSAAWRASTSSSS